MTHKTPKLGLEAGVSGRNRVSSNAPLLFLVVRGSGKMIMKNKNKTNTAVSTFLRSVKRII